MISFTSSKLTTEARNFSFSFFDSFQQLPYVRLRALTKLYLIFIPDLVHSGSKVVPPTTNDSTATGLQQCATASESFTWNTAIYRVDVANTLLGSWVPEHRDSGHRYNNCHCHRLHDVWLWLYISQSSWSQLSISLLFPEMIVRKLNEILSASWIQEG